MFAMRFALGFAAVTLWVLGSAAAEEPERQMNVTQGPETVFAQPVDQILPQLEDAEPTGSNGRVGNELVFWGYRLNNGEPVYFYACSMLGVYDCDQLRRSICPTATNVIVSSVAEGRTVKRTCRRVGVAAPGDRRPGCIDRVSDVELAVGLVSCS